MQANQSTRRNFLRTASLAGASLGLGEWASLLPFSPATADEAQVTPDLVRFSPDIEPIVRLIEDTPPEKCVRRTPERGRSSFRAVLDHADAGTCTRCADYRRR